MIDIKKAEQAFKKYVSNYDQNDVRIDRKTRHTYQVERTAKKISTDLVLSEEDIELATLIGLLHDIGRFDQQKNYKSFIDDKTKDHAIIGSKILFEGNLIREFIEDDKYDNIIKKALENHNKYEIEEGLEEKELLHSKIIRDADKVDNLYIRTYEKFESLFNKSYIGDEYITEDVYNTFINKKCIINTSKKTNMDSWVACIALIFDINFKKSFEILKENDYITKLCTRIEYKNEDTKRKMQEIEKMAKQYIDQKLKETF